MKIKNLNESIKLVEEDTLNPVEDSVKAAVKDVIDGGEEAGIKISPEVAAKEVTHAKAEADEFKLNPYASTAKVSEVTRKLQACLEAAIKDKNNGIDSDYPDMLIYGLAGFGKTAAVKAFCKDHGIIPMELNASTLQPAHLSGLPKVVTDENGNEFQAWVPEAKWIELKNNEKAGKWTILIVDEVNRAKPNVTGTLLGLICDHDLPAPYQENGKWHSKTHYNNILFTVAMINPASRDLFADVAELDPAFLGRMAKTHKADPNKAEFLNVLKDIYGKILAIPTLSQEAKDQYQGQLDIATALLKSRFVFDDRAKAVKAHKAQRTEYEPRIACSYRTLMKDLRSSDGTIASFLQQVDEHNYLEETRLLIHSCLETYHDKISKSNNVFQKTTNPAAAQRSAKSEADVENALKDFENTLI